MWNREAVNKRRHEAGAQEKGWIERQEIRGDRRREKGWTKKPEI